MTPQRALIINDAASLAELNPLLSDTDQQPHWRIVHSCAMPSSRSAWGK